MLLFFGFILFILDSTLNYNTSIYFAPVLVLVFLISGSYFCLENEKGFMRSILLPVLVSIATLLGITAYVTFQPSECPSAVLLFTVVFSFISNFILFLREEPNVSALETGIKKFIIGASVLVFGYVISGLSNYEVGKTTSLLENETVKVGTFFVNVNPDGEFTYYHRIALRYEKGDIVEFSSKYYKALIDHESSIEFAYDVEELWNPIPFPKQKHREAAKVWSSGIAGQEAAYYLLETKITKITEVYGGQKSYNIETSKHPWRGLEWAGWFIMIISAIFVVVKFWTNRK